MILERCRLGTVLALAWAVGAGCEPNPEGPRVPPHPPMNVGGDDRPAPESAARKPVTKNPREIVHPE